MIILSNFDPETELRLPAAIALSDLSLAEIGALTCLAAAHQSAVDLIEIINARFITDEMPTACKSLAKKGLLKMTAADGVISVEINLDLLSAQ